MAYQTLIFDLDGTLSDPFLGTFRCMNYALASCGLPGRTEQDIRNRIGPPLEETMALFAERDDESLIRELVDKYRERYGEFGYQENALYPGTVAMLETLKSNDCRLAVCTSKLRSNAMKILDQFELTPYFEFVSGPDYGQKKHEQLAGLLTDGSIAAASLMIGDRAVDLTAAHGNKLDAAGVLWGYGSLDELQKEQPAFIFESPEQLTQTLLDLRR